MDSVLPLDSPRADLDIAGGKGAGLALLARAGLPVPPGFVVTTAAYRLAGSGPGIPAGLAGEIVAAWEALGSPAVAVRSSATAEDLPGHSFAGQQETVLDVRTAPDLLAAVRRCWDSLFGERAVAYRERAGIADVATAVVVQELVDAAASGVLFTADPLTGDERRMLVDAAWGLGEAVVGGLVTPDSIVADAATGAVRERTVADKQVRTVRGAAGGTVEEPVPAELRGAPVLTDAQVAELVRLGTRAAQLLGGPADVEWALADDRIALLQARPITTITDPWNDSRGRDHLWTNGNLGEAFPGVPTPLSWSFMRIFTARAMSTSAMPGFEAYGRIGGRVYLDLSEAAGIAGLIGLPVGLFRRLSGSAFGRIPAAAGYPRAELDGGAGRSALLATIGDLLRTQRREKPQVAAYVEGNPGHCAALVERIGGLDAAGLEGLWREELRPLLERGASMLQVAGRSDPVALLRAPRLLRKLLGPDGAAALTGGDLESLGPVVGLARVESGELTAAEYLRRWGHRGPAEFEVAAARPAEEPGYVERELARMREAGTSPAALLDRQRAAREAAWARLDREHPRRAAGARRAVAAWEAAAGGREKTRSEVVRVFGVLRAWALRAGEVTGLSVVHLDLAQVLELLGGADPAPLRAAAARNRATVDRYAALPPYPAVIRGTFDPFAWAADPDRRADLYVEGVRAAPAAGAITGFGGAAGVVEGLVRVLGSVADGAALRPGEILVTTATNIGWTPLFPTAAAVVTDIGAPLSHAAIVARELGIPAVVGCGDATTRLHTGDRVRVDGSAGTVVVLEG